MLPKNQKILRMFSKEKWCEINRFGFGRRLEHPKESNSCELAMSRHNLPMWMENKITKVVEGLLNFITQVSGDDLYTPIIHSIYLSKYGNLTIKLLFLKGLKLKQNIKVNMLINTIKNNLKPITWNTSNILFLYMPHSPSHICQSLAGSAPLTLQ